LKQTAFIIASLMTVLLTIYSLIVLNSRFLKQNELEKAVDHAMVNTFSMQEKGKKIFEDEDEMRSIFVKNLAGEFKKGENAELNIRVRKADPVNGLLSVAVKEEFTYPGGKKGNISYERTMIKEKEEIPELMTIELSGVRKFFLEYGSLFTPPETRIAGKTVRAWTDESGEKITFPVKVDKSLKLSPVY